jgi:hypothetical protein
MPKVRIMGNYLGEKRGCGNLAGTNNLRVLILRITNNTYHN